MRMRAVSVAQRTNDVDEADPKAWKVVNGNDAKRQTSATENDEGNHCRVEAFGCAGYSGITSTVAWVGAPCSRAGTV